MHYAVMIPFTEKPGEENTLCTWIFGILDKSNATFVCIVSCNIFIVLYCDRLLESLMSPDAEYTVAITAFWAIETVYQESFAHCIEEGSKTPPELKETCVRWGNEAFGKYCQSLQNIANRCLQKASDEELKKAEVMLLSVLEHEVEFWNMSRGNV